jgi:hypothetical protein
LLLLRIVLYPNDGIERRWASLLMGGDGGTGTLACRISHRLF